MDARGHRMEAPQHDITSLPMHNAHTTSSSFMQHASRAAGAAQHVEGGPSSALPSVTKVKIITSSSSAGGSHGNNGIAPTASTISAGGSFGNNGQALSTHTSAGASYGNHGLTLTSGAGSGEATACTTGINNNGKTTGAASTTLAKSPPTMHTEDIRIPSSLELKPSKKPVRYRECLKNHAASLGGHANDGCGEFMPSGEEGTIEALKCAACNCHRNFHRREVEGDMYAGNCECGYGARDRKRMIEPLFPSPLPLPPPPGLRMPSRPGVLPPSQMIMAFNSHDTSDEYEGGLLSPQSSLKKRFRTKFTTEQKEQMAIFAEKLGWRIQKHDEAAVQQFCAEVGVKRHVLKVWMHNNKHAFGKKLLTQGCPNMGEEEIRPS